MSTMANIPAGLAANKAVVQRFLSAFNDQAPDVFDEIISPDYVDYGHQPPGRGPQGARDDYNGGRGAFSNVAYVIEDMIGDEERAASDRSLNVSGISIYVLADGQITETRHEVRVSEQLGG
jgi:hypothetical protein